MMATAGRITVATPKAMAAAPLFLVGGVGVAAFVGAAAVEEEPAVAGVG